MGAEGRSTGDRGNEMSRRRFCQTAAIGLGGLALGEYLAGRKAWAEGPGPLLPPIITGRSTEICMNSRVSRHGGLSGTATDQQIANVLWAAGRAPVMGSYRTINVKTPNATYVYHPETHSLERVSSTPGSNAINITYDRELDFDAGVADVLALWASVSLWTGTSSQVASCPEMTNLNFGINTVAGVTSQLVAVSSDGTLPNPVTDGANHFEEVLAHLPLASKFRTDLDLAPQRLSQLLWAGYGCTPHWTANGYGGLTVPSYTASYYLTNRIYVINERVLRYCNRTGSSLTTRNHRLELVQNADVRAQVRAALPDLPEAPCYILLCLTQSGLGLWNYRLETGFVAGGMLAQAGASGLACAFKVPLSSAEQTAVKQITLIPSGDYPHAIVALGHRPADLDGDGGVDADDYSAFHDCMGGPEVDAAPGCARADLDADGDVDLADFAEFDRGWSAPS